MKLKYLAIALMAVLFSSCTESVMDDINADKANPPAEMVSAQFIIPGAIMNTAFNTISGNYAWYISSFTEQEFGTGDNQLRRAELRDPGEIASSACFNNEWNSTYSTMHSLYEAMQKCAEGGMDEGKNDIVGMAKVLMAINLGILTDLHGDVPYREALTGLNNLQPKMDKQEDIYKDIFTLLDEGIACLEDGGDDNVGSSDILFGGDADQWIGLAYALKARYKLHLYFRDKNVLNDVIKYANKAIAYGFDGAELDVFDDNNNNPWTAYFWSRLYTASSKTVGDLMEEREDPRLEIYNFDWLGLDWLPAPGDEAAATMTYGCNIPAWLDAYFDYGGASIHVLSKSELYFILAEAKARLGKDATDDFATAVEASFEDYENSLSPYYYSYGMMTCNSSMAGDYIATLPVTLEEIMVQKYLAQTRDEQIEAYNDIRRCKALGEEFIKLTNPKNTNSNGNAWPLRLPYGNSDVIANPNVREAFGTGNAAGMYIYTEPVWWAGGTR